MNNGILIAKLSALETTLNELRSLGVLTAEQLRADWRTRRAVERDLQIAVEVVIDVCQRLIALHGQAPAATPVSDTSRQASQQPACMAGLLAERHHPIP